MTRYAFQLAAIGIILIPIGISISGIGSYEAIVIMWHMIETSRGQITISSVAISLSAYAAWISSRINNRTTKVNERVEKRELCMKRMSNLTEIAKVLLRYRELLENTTYPISDSNGEYDVIISFSHQIGRDWRAKKIAQIHSVIVRNCTDFEDILIFSYRGEFKVDPLSVYIHRDPGLASGGHEWDKLFDALKNAIDCTLGAYMISDELNKESQFSSDSISESTEFKGVVRGSTAISSKNDRRLLDAITYVNVREAKRIVNEVSDINARDTKGRTFLHYAVGDGYWQVVRILCAPDYTADQKDFQDSYGKHTQLCEIVDLLIDAGADFDARDNLGLPIICLAVLVGNFLAVSSLAKRGVNLEATFGKSGLSALHHASLLGNIHIMKELINHGADVNVRNSEGETPLHMILRQTKNLEAAELLITHKADVDVNDNEEVSARKLISQFNNEKLKNLIEDNNTDS